MIGQRLRLARIGSGLSLANLESKLDNRVTAQALSKYERGELMPSSQVPASDPANSGDGAEHPKRLRLDLRCWAQAYH